MSLLIHKIAMIHELRNDTENHKDLQTLHLSIADYKESQINFFELNLKGTTYDIHSIRFIHDSVEIKAYRDLEEVALIQNINSLDNHANPGQNNYIDQIIKLITIDYVCPDHVLLNYGLTIFNTTSFYYEALQSSFVIDPLFPPPEYS